MRSRTMREGSVGLLILLGLGVFGGLVLWLNRLNLSNRTYNFIVSFDKVGGMKSGATVRYRGVTVGKIKELQAKTNGVDVTIEINRADLLIPRDVAIEANQAGFIGETSIDINPKTPLPSNALSLNPLNQCNSKLIICNQDRISGQVGVSFDELLRYTTRLATFYSDPTFYNNVNELTKNASVASAGVAQLTSELSLLSRSARQQLGGISTATNSVTTAAEQTTRQLGTAINRISNTADQFGGTAAQLNDTAKQASLTAAQFGQLAASANELVVSNRGNLGNTLESVRQTSDQLRGLLKGLTDTTNQASSTLGQLNSTVGQVNSSVGQVKIGALVKNLETLSANAAQASANLRDVTSSLNNPSNALVLQQTLESARATFENAQKITSELDELTGDPAFRNNLKKLVNGLSKLVSSTDKLQEQVQIAQTIEPVSTAIHTSLKNAAALPSANDSSQSKVEPAISVNQENIQKQVNINTFPEVPLLSPAPKKRSISQNSLPLAESEKR
jgi:phospholipid/cholesterol/gamma-HCH transport system substrate-binding protein